MKIRLFYEGGPDFPEAYKIALSLESAARNAAAVEQPHKEEGSSIHALQAGARRTGGGGGSSAAGGSGGGALVRERGAGPRRWDSAAGGAGGWSTRDPRLFTSLARGRSCGSCGSTEHIKDTCKF
ncbi:hypothetical protein O0L34_g19196 [Tuta absoluta]|nr:hypothetical protein O0L34_g19196 [Tuta absoluta]